MKFYQMLHHQNTNKSLLVFLLWPRSLKIKSDVEAADAFESLIKLQQGVQAVVWPGFCLLVSFGLCAGT